MKKKLTTLALILIAALSMLALCACNNGPSAEEVIREGLSEEFDMIVNKKGDDWDEMISDIEDEADLSTFGIVQRSSLTFCLMALITRSPRSMSTRKTIPPLRT